MNLETGIKIGTIATLGFGTITQAQAYLGMKYVEGIHKRNKEGKLQNGKLPLYAQELYDSAKRSLKGLDKPFGWGLTRAILHDQFMELPTFKAIYNFVTLNNPEGRSLF